MLYWRKALTEYKSLFPGMDEAIEKKWWPMVQAKLSKNPVPAASGISGDAAVGQQGLSQGLPEHKPRQRGKGGRGRKRRRGGGGGMEQ